MQRACKSVDSPPDVVEKILDAASSSLKAEEAMVVSPFAGHEPRSQLLAPRAALAARLEIATAIFLRDYEWEKKPTASQLRDRLEAIRAAAAALLKTLGLGIKHRSNPDLIPYAILSALRQHAGFMKPNGDDRVRAAVTGIKDLNEWIERELWNMETYRLSRPMQKPSRGPQSTNKGDRAFNKLLGALAGIWRDLFGRTIDTNLVSGNAQTKGRATGDFFRFVSACLAPLDLPERLTAERSLATRLIRLKKETAGADVAAST